MSIDSSRLLWNAQREQSIPFSVWSTGNIHHQWQREGEKEGRSRGSDRWRKDLNSERIFPCLKLEHTSGYIRERNVRLVMRLHVFSPLLCFFLHFLFCFVFPTWPPHNPLHTHAHTYIGTGKMDFYIVFSWCGQTGAELSSSSMALFVCESTSFFLYQLPTLILSICPSSKIDH